MRRTAQVAAACAAVCLLTWLAAPAAQAVPSVTFKCTPAPENCSGWYRSNVTIDWTVLPSDATVLSGCQDKSFSADTPGTSEFCSVDDGSATVTVELKIRVDKTPPVVTGGQPARAADVDGWYNRAVGLSFAGSDLTSGIDSCTSTTYGGPDSASAVVAGTCVDKAGNVSAPLGYGLKYDATAPTVSAAQPERPANANGWFNQAVAFDVQGTDATSGVADCPPVTYSGPDSATAAFMGSCRDRAGNSAARSFALKYDATAPAATAAQAARGADVNGWYNHSVAVSFSGSDQLSGIDRCTAATYAGPDSGTATMPGTCTDRAGNVSPALAFGLKYDATKPVVSGGQPERPSDSSGWYNRSVAVTFSGTDQTAGVEACTGATYAGPDSGAASVSGTCRDRAGNVSDPFGYGLKYDATAPQVTAADADRPADANGWYNHAVGFTIRGSDATSGIASCPSASYNGADSATATITGTCRDTAGNAASRVFGLQYDDTAPTVTKGTAARAADVDGWYNRPVAIAFEGTDNVSGVAGCSTPNYAGPDGAAASAAGTCTDRAGNVGAPLAYALKYDATAPTVTAGTPARAADSNGWYNRPVAVAFTGTDQTAGIAGCSSATYAGADSATASVAGNCTDKAGNTSGPLGYGLKYDATAPQVTAADPDRPADANGWFNRPVGFTIRGSDATSGIASCPSVSYSGPDTATASITGTCRDTAGNTASRAFALQYDDTAPAVTRGVPARAPDLAGWYVSPVAIAFEGTDGLSGVAGCTTVTYSGPDSTAAGPAGTCTDRAGNVSAALAFGLKYDATAPTVTGGIPSRAADANGWYNHAVAVAFTGADPISGLASCTSATYDGADSATAAVAGTCTDKAGNTSGPLGFGLKYDETPPQVTAGTPRRGPDVNGWYNREVAYDFAGTDATSGIAACPSITYSGPDGGAASATGRCTDRAGNSSDRPFGLKYDATDPAVTSSTPDRPPDAGGWYNRPVSVGFGGSDATSGVEGCTTKSYAGPDVQTVTLTGTCTDKAGNLSAVDGRTIKYDATAPVVTGSQAARVPDVAGWYNHAVDVAFSGSDAMSGVDAGACTAVTYGGPDSATATVPGICRDRAGNVSTTSQFGLKYDATAPQVTAAEPNEPANANGWFIHPVSFTIRGTDATSGLDGDVCPPVDYAGPDGADAVLVGRCRDKAGNAGTRNFSIDYDATPPALSLSAESGDGSVALSWQTTPDATSIEVVRSPGVDGQPSSVVFSGPGPSFVDARVDNGTRYSYEVHVADAAGNASTQSIVGFPTAAPPNTEISSSALPGVVAVPGAAPAPRKRPAIAPAAGSVFPATSPPLLQWPSVGRASYYNVQLFRGERKLLSVWPARPRYRLERSWRFRGKPRRLVPGTYRWMVWPGYGKRSKGRYGKPIVKSTFVIQKATAAR